MWLQLTGDQPPPPPLPSTHGSDDRTIHVYQHMARGHFLGKWKAPRGAPREGIGLERRGRGCGRGGGGLRFLGPGPLNAKQKFSSAFGALLL